MPSQPTQSSVRSVSARKAQANRQNALKSTGPKTLRGKAYSRRNSLKHGLFANDLFSDFAIQSENPQEFQNLRDRLWEEYQPVGVSEELEVEHIAVFWWRLKRAWRYENAEILGEQLDASIRVKTKLRDLMLPKDRALTLLLETAGKEIEATGEISSQLQEKMFAADSSFRERWAQLDIKHDEVVGRVARELGLSAEQIENTLREDSGMLANSDFALLTTALALRSIQSQTEKRVEPFLNLAFDRRSIPNRDALDKLLRYEAAIERDLSRCP